MRARLGRHAAALQEESFGNSMVSLTALLLARSSKSVRWRLDRHLAPAMDIACA